MRTFKLIRLRDVSGISGEGAVAEGVTFQDGTAVVHWLSETPSINIYRSMEELLHIHGHEGATHVEFTS